MNIFYNLTKFDVGNVCGVRQSVLTEKNELIHQGYINNISNIIKKIISLPNYSKNIKIIKGKKYYFKTLKERAKKISYMILLNNSFSLMQ